MQNIEAPRRSQAVIPAPAGENVVSTPSTQTLDQALANSRNIGLRRRIGLAGAGLVLAASSIGASASFGSRASAQGESPAPSMEPAPSLDPNGGLIAEGELSCDVPVQPAAVVNPDGQAIAAINGAGTEPEESIAPVVSPAPSAPAGGDLVAGDPTGENCDLGPTAQEAIDMLLSQDDMYEGDDGIEKTSFKKLNSTFLRKPDAEKEDAGGIWYKYNEELLQLKHPYDMDVPITRDSFEAELEVIENGFEFTESKLLSRLEIGAGFAVFLVGLREQATNPELKDALLRASDLTVEHLLANVAKTQEDKDFLRTKIQGSATLILK